MQAKIIYLLISNCDNDIIKVSKQLKTNRENVDEKKFETKMSIKIFRWERNTQLWRKMILFESKKKNKEWAINYTEF